VPAETCAFAVAISSSYEALLHTKLLPIILLRKPQLTKYPENGAFERWPLLQRHTGPVYSPRAG